ncbi:MAG: asparaginase [Christensenellaceae bacterium]|jgi:L-asparaginase|nr:asparaginase [Christensenellaceae bacterium]
MEKLHLIITGGTIDSEWTPSGADTFFVGDECHTLVQPRHHSHIRKYILRNIRPTFEIVESVVSMVDSNNMTDEIRADIIAEIEKSDCENFIVSHGTDTLIATAKMVKNHFKNTTKKIVFLGAFVPLVSGEPTDAPFNLGYAVSKFDCLAGGVYIAMNAQIFDPENCAKNFETKVFHTVK